MATVKNRSNRSPRHLLIASFAILIVSSLGSLSAHVVRGLINPTQATAFVSSPAAGQDAPVPIVWGTRDTKLRVACFHVANTSVPRADDPDWPRVTSVGFELPGTLSGFSLLAPLEGDWNLVEGGAAALPGHDPVTLDFALVTTRNALSKAPHDLPGIPPGQPAVRGSGPRFCVAGPFPDTLPNAAAPGGQSPTTIEQIINGVVVRFSRVEASGSSTDSGVWDNPGRVIPLYPE